MGTRAPELLANELGLPEGPVLLPSGAVLFVEEYRSQLTIWTHAAGVSRFAYTAGGPNSSVLGSEGEIYVCQNGGRAGSWRAEEMAEPSIQLVDRPGTRPQSLLTEVEGMRLNGPNDLAFGPDGSLYFTDPGDFRPGDPDPSRIFALHPDGTASIVVDFPEPTFPNGLAFDFEGRLVWVESYTGRLARLAGDGTVEYVMRLPGDNPVPDGMAVDAGGRFYICDIAAGGIHVVARDGAIEAFHAVGTRPTNCAFAGGALLVTDAGPVTETMFHGCLWRLEVGCAGAAIRLGHINVA